MEPTPGITDIDWSPVITAAVPFLIAVFAVLTEMMRRRLRLVEGKVDGLTDRLIAAKIIEATAAGVAQEQLAQANRDAAVAHALEKHKSALPPTATLSGEVQVDTVNVEADTAHVVAPKKGK